MNNIEIYSTGIPSVRKDIRKDSNNYCFELTFSKNVDIDLINNSRLVIIDQDYKEIGNEISFDPKTFKAKFISFRPYKHDVDYYISLINADNILIKRIIKFRLSDDNKLNFEKVNEKTNMNALKNTRANTSTNNMKEDDAGSDCLHSGAANRVTGAVAQGGKLFLYQDKLVFQGHGLNIGKDKWEIMIAELKSVETQGSLNAITILDKKNNSFMFRVNNRKEWITKIEQLIAGN